MIRIEGLYHHYPDGDTMALKGIDFEAKQGEIILLLGKNGSGKTTLLDILSGRLVPSHGKFSVENKKVDFATFKDWMTKNTAYLPQFPRSIMPNLLTVSEMYGLCSDHYSLELKNKALASLSLGDKWDQSLDSLSEGEFQRVVAINLLLHEKPIVLGDEITAFLDDKNAQKTIEVIKKLVETVEKTFIIATHDLNLVPYATRTYYLRNGTVEKVIEGDGQDRNKESYVNSEGLISLPGELFDYFKLPTSIGYEIEKNFLKFSFPQLSEQKIEQMKQLEVKTLANKVLKIIRLKKSWGGHLVLDITDFTFDIGIHVIYGASGVGKTTLLRIMAGIEQAEETDIQFHENNVSKTPCFHYLSQNPGLPLNILVSELLEIQVKGSHMEHELFGLAEEIGILELKEKFVMELSGGQQKKLALLLAFSNDCDIYLLDEPTAFIDANSRLSIINFIKSHFSDKLVIIATHDVYLGRHFSEIHLRLTHLEKKNDI